MKAPGIALITVLAVYLASSSCKDIIEKDISKKQVHLLAPADGSTTSVLATTFWWDDVDGAETYRLQIVAPSFNSITQFILDTSVTSNRFTYTFSLPATYAWRVRAENNGSETVYTTASFTIDSTLNLSGQVVSLVQPADQYTTSLTTVFFRWSSLYNATQYRFRLEDLVTGSLLKDTEVAAVSLTMSLDTGAYTWKVRAENNLSTSGYSSHTLYIDQTAPAASVPVTPAYGDSSTSPVALSWRRSAGTVLDSLFVYSDSALTTLNLTIATADTFYSYSGSSFRSYFWRLKSTDAANNTSPFGTLSRFYIR